MKSSAVTIVFIALVSAEFVVKRQHGSFASVVRVERVQRLAQQCRRLAVLNASSVARTRLGRTKRGEWATKYIMCECVEGEKPNPFTLIR